MKKKKIKTITIAVVAIISAVLGSLVYLRFRPVPEAAVKVYLMAKNRYMDGDFTTAENTLEALWKREPKLFQAGLLLAKAKYFKGDHAGADETLKQLLKRYPNYHEAGLWKARTELQLGRLSEAKERLEELASWLSDDPRVLYYLAKAAEAEGDARVALDYYGKAVLYEEEGGKIRLELGRYYWRLGMPERALLELNRALDILPSDSPLRPPTVQIRASIENSPIEGTRK